MAIKRYERKEGEQVNVEGGEEGKKGRREEGKKGRREEGKKGRREEEGLDLEPPRHTLVQLDHSHARYHHTVAAIVLSPLVRVTQ